MNLLFIILISAISSAATQEKNCAGLLAGSIKLNRTLRIWADAIPVGQEWLLPKPIVSLREEPLTSNDRLAAMMSENKLFDEVGYHEAVDIRGNVLFTSDFASGDQETVNSSAEFFAFLRELGRRYPRLSDGQVAKIRSVHTHPPNFTRDFFSYADAHKMLLIHAMLEILGGNNIEVEESILYPGFTGYRTGIGPFFKRTLIIPTRSLSWLNGDYLLNPTAEEGLRDLDNELKRKSGVTLPNAWDEINSRRPGT